MRKIVVINNIINKSYQLNNLYIYEGKNRITMWLKIKKYIFLIDGFYLKYGE